MPRRETRQLRRKRKEESTKEEEAVSQEGRSRRDFVVFLLFPLFFPSVASLGYFWPSLSPLLATRLCEWNNSHKANAKIPRRTTRSWFNRANNFDDCSLLLSVSGFSRPIIYPIRWEMRDNCSTQSRATVNLNSLALVSAKQETGLVPSTNSLKS